MIPCRSKSALDGDADPRQNVRHVIRQAPAPRAAAERNGIGTMELARQLRQRAASGELVLGTFMVELKALGVPAVLKHSGFDFFMIDLEHGCYSDAEGTQLIEAGKRHGICPLVRVASADHERITHMLDSGAQGLLIPMARSLDYVKEAVAQSKYTPLGRRGMHFMRPHTDFDPPADAADYMQRANENLITAIQIETMEAVEQMDEIAAIDGVDMLYLGPGDLSAAMGMPGQAGHPRIWEVARRIIEVCRKHGKIPGGHLGGVADAPKAMAMGMNVVAYAASIRILINGATQHIKDLRSNLEGATG